MKNSVKLFGVLAVSLFMFSCSSDEQDADLERAIKMSENIYQKDGDDAMNNDATSDSEVIKEETNPLIIVKRD